MANPAHPSFPASPQVDDPLDAIAVHAGCGIWGLIAGGAFAAPNMVTEVFGPLPGTEDGQVSAGWVAVAVAGEQRTPACCP